MDTRTIEIKNVHETDGDLYVLETDNDIPFSIQRIFYIQNVPANKKRGGHASKTSDFVYICLRGKVKVCIDNGIRQQFFLLEKANHALYLPKETWMEFYEFSEDALLLTLASEKYEENDYFNNYEEFVREKQ